MKNKNTTKEIMNDKNTDKTMIKQF